MKFNDFIINHNVDYSHNCVERSDIYTFESLMDVSIGEQLREYILSYGYLGYEFVEFFGINNKLMEKSNMIKETEYLHTYFYKTKDLIVIENQGDGDYYLVDKDDNVYRYLSSRDELTALNIKLFDYILNRFEFVAETL